MPRHSPSSSNGACSATGSIANLSLIISIVLPKSAPIRSILFTNATAGSEKREACRHTCQQQSLDSSNQRKYRFALCFHSRHSVEYKARTIEYAHRPLDLREHTGLMAAADGCKLEALTRCTLSLTAQPSPAAHSQSLHALIHCDGTSIVKSACPGVSTRLIWWPSQSNEMAAA